MGSGGLSRQVLTVMAALMAVLASGLPAAAQAVPANTSGPFATALKTWAGRHRIKRAFVVVRREGRVVETFALGGADPARPVPLASLSKAITAPAWRRLSGTGSSGSTRRCRPRWRDLSRSMASRPTPGSRA